MCNSSSHIEQEPLRSSVQTIEPKSSGFEIHIPSTTNPSIFSLQHSQSQCGKFHEVDKVMGSHLLHLRAWTRLLESKPDAMREIEVVLLVVPWPHQLAAERNL